MIGVDQAVHYGGAIGYHKREMLPVTVRRSGAEQDLAVHHRSHLSKAAGSATHHTARVLSGCTYVFQFFCSFMVFYTIDCIGRRKLMMFGTSGMALTFVALAPLIANVTHSKGCASAAAALIFIFTMFFSVGALGINYVYGAEVAPLAHRTQIYALPTVTLWTFNFLVVEVTPPGFSKLEYKFFIVFTATNLLLLMPGKLCMDIL